MNHKLKMKLRALSHESKAFSKLYRMASGIKTRRKQNMSDEEFIKQKYKENTGKELNLDNPQTFNEKLQWLKLYNHDPLYTTLVDKYAVKQYVADKIGAEHVIPVVGGPWKSAEDIDFDALPEQFVLKCNHDCGSVVICTDKTKLNIPAVRAKLNKALKHNYYYDGREWPYKNVKPCIFAEKYMVDESGYELKDYKFFCFNGEPKCLFIITGRFSGDMRLDWFDSAFVRMPFERGYPNSNRQFQKPERFEEMKKLAENLTTSIPFVRCDFYYAQNTVYFGEFTFFPGGGMEEFKPPEWDKTFGDCITLPAKRI